MSQATHMAVPNFLQIHLPEAYVQMGKNAKYNENRFYLFIIQ